MNFRKMKHGSEIMDRYPKDPSLRVLQKPFRKDSFFRKNWLKVLITKINRIKINLLFFDYGLCKSPTTQTQSQTKIHKNFGYLIQKRSIFWEKILFFEYFMDFIIRVWSNRPRELRKSRSWDSMIYLRAPVR